MHIEYKVTNDNNNQKVSQILKNHLKFSRGEIRRIKRCAGLMVNDQAVRLNSLVKEGDLIRVNFQDDNDQPVIPQDIPLNILFEDEHILVVNKPFNMLVHPLSYHVLNTLANGVIYHWQLQGHNSKFRSVNRLDKDTSGVILIAKSSYICHQLSEQMKKGICRREYLAVVHNRITMNSGILDFPIGWPNNDSLVFGVTSQGKEAITHFTVIQRFASGSLVKLRLETGRTHQIRVHMRHFGHPLMGDELYGGSLELIHRQALHSWHLEFNHPVTKKNMQLEAPLPADMTSLIHELKSLRKFFP
ncbi:23S rRNA pseudouridine1911/1915/1917 synthase [Desulfotomaculum arcticum]|uniref:Pseudouridine synthase n=1 Tax=Desulfotruncus arcticus DSM 17038 TaxID=1121424 RepID=A0A1I2XR20_9FIRM|nr:RluA family pseudouridine synthase [Desulfotruncus arcticus]SFH15924.1 23S rRNA pseudouridine1911/1915/1917 synthase [Desulfotomaculum arcticum] [Desulfotruncus arcticus DSM 17038]